MGEVVNRAVKEVRDAVASAATGLTSEQYVAFIEELLADADSWKMELEEMQAEDEDDE